MDLEVRARIANEALLEFPQSVCDQGSGPRAHV